MSVPNDQYAPRNPFYDANDLVRAGFYEFQGYADNFIRQASNTLDSLGDFTFEPITFSSDFLATFSPTPFQRPTFELGTLEVGEITAEDPGQPQINAVEIGSFGAPPNAPTLPTFSAPGQFTTPPPEPNPIDLQLDEIVVSDFDGLPTVADPSDSFLTLTLPDALVIDLDDIDFDETPPEFNIDIPSVSFGWAPTPYSSDLLDAVKARIQTMLLGGTGLPAAIEQALFDRGRAREDMLATKAVQEVTEEMASRGFDEPSGITLKRLREVRQKNQDADLDHSRKVEIENKQLEIDQLKFAVTQGIALEQVLMENALRADEMNLRAGQLTVELAYRLLDVKIAAYNAELEGYKARAAMVREKVQLILARVEVYKAQLAGEQAKADVNKSLVDIYEGRIRAAVALVEAYNAEVRAAQTRAEINTQRVQAAKLQVESYGEEVRAYASLVDAHRSNVEASLGTVRGAESLAQAYASIMQGYRAKADVAIESARTKNETNRVNVEAFRAKVDRVNALLRAQEANANAKSSAFTAQARAFEAEGQLSIAESAAGDRQQQIAIESERSRVQLNLQTLIAQSEQARDAARMVLQALETRAQALSQLAASSMSGVNLGAQISGSAIQSDSFSIGYNYSGEA